MEYGPTVSEQRIVSLDFVRGIAVLGILVMNIQAFSMPFSAYANPSTYGDLTGINYWVWLISHVVTDQKFMTLFSILFGVGVLLFSERADQKEGHSGKRHYIRMGWLFLFGLMHALFIWWGDILMMYAISGCIAYLFRQSSMRVLLLTSAGLISFVGLIMLLGGLFIKFVPEEDIITEILKFWSPEQAAIEAELAAYSGTWAEAFSKRIEMAIFLQSQTLQFVPKILGLNLLGMALYKSGFAKGLWSTKTYLVLAAILIAIGWSLSYVGASNMYEEQFFYQYALLWGMQFNYWGSLFTAVGYFSLMMWVCRNGVSGMIRQAFARVGQMAFTNYIAMSVICTYIIYGHGFNLFGRMERIEQVYFTFGVWAFLIVISYLWLGRFRYGPLEWAWRSLTYQKRQSIK